MVAPLSLVETWHIWKPMAKLGAAFMFAGLATAATLLLVRGRISQELGLEAAGHFAAAWGITMTYVGFLLGAMAADYYPRLTELIHDRVAAVRLMNDQAQLGLAIGGPVLLLLIGLAPWLITLLYSAEFAPAIPLLQWQTVGNLFKISGWALGFATVALGHGKLFLFTQIHFNVIFLSLFLPTLGWLGILAAGPAFTVSYLMQLCLEYIVARRILGFRWQPLSLGLLALHVFLTCALFVISFFSPQLAAFASVVLALSTGIFGVRVVLSKIGTQGRIPTRLYGVFERLGWPIQPAAYEQQGE
jgi:PST family polysaccharide transporter